MRSNVPRMLYSPERSSLAGTAPTGSVLPQIIFPAGVHSGKRHTFYGVKDENGSSMGRGYKSIGKLSAFLLRTFSLCCSLCCLAACGPIAAHAQTPAKQNSKSAKTWDKEGQAAEAHQDYDTAFEDYQHALQSEAQRPSLQNPLRAHAFPGRRRPRRPRPRPSPERRPQRRSRRIHSRPPDRSQLSDRPAGDRSGPAAACRSAERRPSSTHRADVETERDPRQHRLHLRPR